MKIKLKNIFLHTALVFKHKYIVFIHTCKCGIPLQGIVHDMSKFSPTEFFESVRYYQGDRSPIGACRRATGMSHAWLHHKGRNRHHIEYWYDPECSILPIMPYKYAVECVCDKLAATKTYARGSYNESLPLIHWNKYGRKVPGNEKTMLFFERVFEDIEKHGEKHVLNKKYMKKTYAEICG